MTGTRRLSPSQSSLGGRRNGTSIWVGALVAALVVLVPACAPAEGRGDVVAHVLSGDTLELARGDAWTAVQVTQSLRVGARVRTGDAEARLALGAGEVWLAPRSLAVVGADEVDVVRGDALITSDGPLVARLGDTSVQGEAVYRLAPGVMPVLKVYEGTVSVERLAEDRSVSALRQLDLGTSRLPGEPAPLDYDAGDAWDQVLLPAAVAFDKEAKRLARGLERQHGAAPQDAAFYGSFTAADASAIPVLAETSPLRTPDHRFGPPSDALLTLFLAEAVVAHQGGDVATVTKAIADLRVAGARWGGVALEHGISMAELARIVDLARERHLAEAPDGAGGADALPDDGGGDGGDEGSGGNGGDEGAGDPVQDDGSGDDVDPADDDDGDGTGVVTSVPGAGGAAADGSAAAGQGAGSAPGGAPPAQTGVPGDGDAGAGGGGGAGSDGSGSGGGGTTPAPTPTPDGVAPAPTAPRPAPPVAPPPADPPPAVPPVPQPAPQPAPKPGVPAPVPSVPAPPAPRPQDDGLVDEVDAGDGVLEDVIGSIGGLAP